MPLISERISLIRRCQLLVERPNRSYFAANDDDLVKAAPSDDIAKRERKREYSRKLRAAGKTAQDIYENNNMASVLDWAKRYL